jgi:hypothetical protein
VQARDVLKVVVHCCMHSSHYNPFFALLAIHLCGNDQDHCVTLRYARVCVCTFCSTWLFILHVRVCGLTCVCSVSVVRMVMYIYMASFELLRFHLWDLQATLRIDEDLPPAMPDGQIANLAKFHAQVLCAGCITLYSLKELVRA